MIIIKSNRERLRKEVIEYIKEKKNQKPGYTVVDIGGSANPWCDEHVDFYVDFNGIGNNIINGDIQSEEVWEKIKALKPDFCICTHTLEDIRDPMWVVNKINQNFSAGFISMPNKHQELTLGLESIFFPGWSHHRWIFSLVDDKLIAIAKFPVTTCFVGFKKILIKLISLIALFPLMAKVLRKIKFLPTKAQLNWLDKSLANSNFELGFLYENSFEFGYINNDYSGNNLDQLIILYQNKLSVGL